VDRRPIVTELDRRQLVASLCAVGSLVCLGGRRALAGAGPTDALPHKFAADAGMTYEEVYQFAYSRGFIPMMRALVERVGLETIQEAASESARLGAAARFQALPSREFADWVAVLKASDPLVDHALTIEIVDESETAVEVRVTECLWAKTFREADAADIGYACICHPDFAMAQAFNPKMRMIRDKTLMQGHSHCNHRWVIEG
jgi:hypothetical protein